MIEIEIVTLMLDKLDGFSPAKDGDSWDDARGGERRAAPAEDGACARALPPQLLHVGGGAGEGAVGLLVQHHRMEVPL